MASSDDDTRLAVARLTRALDADDFTAAGALLADDCVYETGTETLRGREAIVASYAKASARAHQWFDEVRYESELGAVDGATVTVTFTDYLFKVGCRWHRYRCRQEFTAGADARIVRIVHREIPEERVAVDAYFRECGIER